MPKFKKSKMTEKAKSLIGSLFLVWKTLFLSNSIATMSEGCQRRSWSFKSRSFTVNVIWNRNIAFKDILREDLGDTFHLFGILPNIKKMKIEGMSIPPFVKKERFSCNILFVSISNVPPVLKSIWKITYLKNWRISLIYGTSVF